MFDWLKPSDAEFESVPVWVLGLRLVMALVFGYFVAEIHRRTKKSATLSTSFTVTLVMLSILIAIVTQVVGSNAARAFSLVGALSIIRFRTVVQDTRDTAFVIFAVVIGMAVGASNFLVATMGLGVTGLAAYLWRVPTKATGWGEQRADLFLRMAIGKSPDSAALPLLERSAVHVDLMAVETSQKGSSIDYSYRLQLEETANPAQIVQELNQLEGVQAVQLKRGDQADA